VTYICPRPECTNTSEAPVYCRHGINPDLTPGNWMLDENDPALMPLTAHQKIAKKAQVTDEVEEAKAGLLAYLTKVSQPWVRSFELRTMAAPGMSTRAINLAYTQLLEQGEIETGKSDFVRRAQPVERGER
jgi:hypothetical protein